MDYPFNKNGERLVTEIGLYFEPEAIHVMRLGETEEEFDARLESYDARVKRCRLEIEIGILSLT